MFDHAALKFTVIRKLLFDLDSEASDDEECGSCDKLAMYSTIAGKPRQHNMCKLLHTTPSKNACFTFTPELLDACNEYYPSRYTCCHDFCHGMFSRMSSYGDDSLTLFVWL